MDASHEHPAGLARRNPDVTFRELCNRLAWHGHTREVNDELAVALQALDPRHWHIERDFPIEAQMPRQIERRFPIEVPIPFMLFGPTGIFLLQASRGYWTTRDIVEMCQAADTLVRALIGYPDPVRCGIVMLEETIEHRQHFSNDGAGPCWIVAGELLVHWLYAFRDRGLAEGDTAFVHAWASASRVREPRRLFEPVGGDDACHLEPE
jgi:hypothetical protein